MLRAEQIAEPACPSEIKPELLANLRQGLTEGQGTLYLRLASALRQSILDQSLAAEEQLPTVRALATALSLSRGTVKHAYNVLAGEQLLMLQQGRGSFVSCPKINEHAQSSRKDQAMFAIDTMLDSLSSLGFSPREIQIYLELKLRERAESGSKARIAIVADSPELRSLYLNALAALPAVELFAYPTEEVLNAFVDLSSFDICVCNEMHYREIELLAKAKLHVQLMDFALEPETAIAIAGIAPEQKVAILSLSKTYAGIMRTACSSYGNLYSRAAARLFRDPELATFLADKDVLLMPEGYLSLVSSKTHATIRNFATRKKIILFKERCERSALVQLREHLQALTLRST